MSDKKVVDARYAKSAEYQKVINEIESKAKCPFCPDNFKYHKNPILHYEGSWYITASSWPYPNTQHHFIILGNEHKEQFGELTSSDWDNIRRLVNWAGLEYNIPGGAVNMRFGDTAYTGATVVHIHAHLIVPKLNRDTGVGYTVNFPVG